MNAEQNVIPENRKNWKVVSEILVILALGAVVYSFATCYDFLERIVEFSKQHENWEMDELITMAIFLVVALALFSMRRWQEVTKSKIEITKKNKKLQKALAEIKQLRGIVPICASCKKIRDDKGFWHQVEEYVRDHTDAEFSHGVCPECIIKLYPDFIDGEQKNEGETS
jgi:hypothetical protein